MVGPTPPSVKWPASRRRSPSNGRKGQVPSLALIDVAANCSFAKQQISGSLREIVPGGRVGTPKLFWWGRSAWSTRYHSYKLFCNISSRCRSDTAVPLQKELASPLVCFIVFIMISWNDLIYQFLFWHICSTFDFRLGKCMVSLATFCRFVRSQPPQGQTYLFIGLKCSSRWVDFESVTSLQK